ncbi:hypothetical protein ACQP3C_30000, partial [Escherichia coli]
HSYSVFLRFLVEDTVFPQKCVFGHFVKKSDDCGSFGPITSSPLVNVAVFMPVSCYFYYYVSAI